MDKSSGNPGEGETRPPRAPAAPARAWLPGILSSPGSWGRTVLTLIVFPPSIVHPAAAAPHHTPDKGKTEQQTSSPNKRAEGLGLYPISPVVDSKVSNGVVEKLMARSLARLKPLLKRLPEGGTAVGAYRNSGLLLRWYRLKTSHEIPGREISIVEAAPWG